MSDKEQPIVSDQFGANSWYIESLMQDYRENPEALPEAWRKYFSGGAVQISSVPKKAMPMPSPAEGDETKLIAGSAARILDNMESSLTIPVATSQRIIPVKLLEENRVLINSHLERSGAGKISFTHLIGWALIKACKHHPAVNNAYTEVDGKPYVIQRGSTNLGVAIDVVRKDGTRSLLVPNIKGVQNMTFSQYWQAYEDLVKRSRKGAIDPAEFQGTTITLTNPGTIGTFSSVPRLMLGQGVIIATGAIQFPAEYQAMAPSMISSLGISKVVSVTSTYDHRIIQGAESGLFLKEVHELLTGKDGFYDEVFQDLKIPYKALTWQNDVSTQGLDTIPNAEEIMKQGRVRQMINMYRVRGHLLAQLDPLGRNSQYHPELDPQFYNLTIWDLDRQFLTHDFGGVKSATLREILKMLNRTYCDKIGVEYMHIQSPVEKEWIQNAIEPSQNHPTYDHDFKKNILKRLLEAEELEHFIHHKFIGHKRFSIEGSETLIPLLDYLLSVAADNGVPEAVIGMAHRGRLNVLSNIVGKSFESIFSEFEDIKDPNSFAGSGDVKYHLGAYGRFKNRFRREISVTISPNPSHLEWVNPVVEGIVRAKQTRTGDERDRSILPILLHGDAAFAGQGVVAETLNLSQLNGYRTGGSIHIIVNNQIGFTTTPEEARSSVYATDVAKMVQAPIFHVNGDDPEAAMWVTKIAFDYRRKFKKDIVIDLFGYRRHGHNEGDEPGFTQPILYDLIKKHPSVLTIYAEKLIGEKVITQDQYASMKSEFLDKLNQAHEKVSKSSAEYKVDVPRAVYALENESKGMVGTAISDESLEKIVTTITTVPPDIQVHPKLKKFLEKRRELITVEGAGADWALAETIAFGSLLLDGTPVRLSGQDSVRGTFSQRHLALTDVYSGKEYYPLNAMSKEQARLEAYDSFLSEAAVLGFEYGYSVADPLALVLWEAQFGDFANGAQIIIDNFIVASNEKWQTPNNLVMMLPHGQEGQGPEHSSARLERFLILSAQNSLEVCQPTTPAQHFHLLRRQMKKSVLRPLVIMTPKSLLRLPEAKSLRSEFTQGGFREFIDDHSITDKNAITRVVLTSGKIYYELVKVRPAGSNSAIVRIEQYYPFAANVLADIFTSYPKLQEVVWVQEEPENMGAWFFLRHRLKDLLGDVSLRYDGREASASPAVGSARLFAMQQQKIVENAFK